MSRDNLGSKQRIILHNCLIRNERYDLVVTPHKQTKGFIRSKRQTRNETIIAKQKRIIKKAVAESETTTKQELQNLKGSIDKNTPIDQQNYFLTQNLHHHHQLKANAELKNHILINRLVHTIRISKQDTLKVTHQQF